MSTHHTFITSGNLREAETCTRELTIEKKADFSTVSTTWEDTQEFIVQIRKLVLTVVAAVLLPILAAASAEAKTYYVSHNGDNTDGSSWQHAWNELDQINWHVILKGDLILLDGGTNGMVYRTMLFYPPFAPSVTIALAEDSDHGGQAILDGTSIYNPCGETAGIISMGEGLTLEGRRRSGIVMRNWFNAAIWNESPIFIDHVEIYNNVDGIDNDGPCKIWNSILHDNGYALGGGLSTESFRDWFYNTTAPVLPSNAPEGWSTCIWIGGPGPGGPTTYTQCIFGPKEVTIMYGFPGSLIATDCLFIDASDATIEMGQDTGASIAPPNYSGQFYLDRCTSFINPFSSASCFKILKDPSPSPAPFGEKFIIRNSVFYGGNCTIPAGDDSIVSSTNNTQYKVTGNTLVLSSRQANPEFLTDVSHYTSSTPVSIYIETDFALSKESPAAGTGSRVTSIPQLVDLMNLPQAPLATTPPPTPPPPTPPSTHSNPPSLASAHPYPQTPSSDSRSPHPAPWGETTNGHIYPEDLEHLRPQPNINPRASARAQRKNGQYSGKNQKGIINDGVMNGTDGDTTLALSQVSVNFASLMSLWKQATSFAPPHSASQTQPYNAAHRTIVRSTASHVRPAHQSTRHLIRTRTTGTNVARSDCSTLSRAGIRSVNGSAYSGCCYSMPKDSFAVDGRVFKMDNSPIALRKWSGIPAEHFCKCTSSIGRLYSLDLVLF
jgi:hypothetical protein